ncbi:MAG: hypothetical protein ACK5ME_07400 [Parahaliea sp.]
MFLYKAIALLSSIFFVATAQATAYIEITDYPWSPYPPYTSNKQAMDLAFGTGNWTEYSDLDGAVPFLAETEHDFIMIDGSANAIDTLKTYLITYNSEITSFVNNGGALYINAAFRTRDFTTTPSSERYIETGFNDVTLMPTGSDDYAGVVDSAHEIFTNYDTPIVPNTADSNRYMGDEFAWGEVTGTGLTSIIEGADRNGILNGEKFLSEIKYGTKQVCILFGTMTPYIDTQPKGTNLQTSILKYAQDCSKLSPPVPPTGEAKAIPAISLSQIILSIAGILFLGLTVFRRFEDY